MAGRPRQFDESEVVERALDLFWRQGYERTGLTQLLDTTGLARQSLYNVFGEKRGLFLRVLGRYSERSLSRVRGVLERPGAAYDAVCDLVLSFAEPAAGDPAGCLMVNTACEFGPDDLEVMEVVSGHWRLVEGLFRSALERAQAEGDLPAGLDAGAVGLTLAQVLHALAVMQRAGRSREEMQSVASVALEGVG